MAGGASKLSTFLKSKPIPLQKSTELDHWESFDPEDHSYIHVAAHAPNDIQRKLLKICMAQFQIDLVTFSRKSLSTTA
jgi:hypothetical protein